MTDDTDNMQILNGYGALILWDWDVMDNAFDSDKQSLISANSTKTWSLKHAYWGKFINCPISMFAGAPYMYLTGNVERDHL